jgi:hypothetical protein
MSRDTIEILAQDPTSGTSAVPSVSTSVFKVSRALMKRDWRKLVWVSDFYTTLNCTIPSVLTATTHRKRCT